MGKKMLLKNALEEGFTVVADFQTAGRGQAAKKWESERGKNLLFRKNLTRYRENNA